MAALRASEKSKRAPAQFVGGVSPVAACSALAAISVLGENGDNSPVGDDGDNRPVGNKKAVGDDGEDISIGYS